MIKFKTKKRNDDIVDVKASFEGDLIEIQAEMVMVMATFGTELAKQGIEKEKVKKILGSISKIAETYIKYEEGE